MARTIFTNRSAYRDYTIVEKLEAGIKLQGWEVKSLKEGMADLRGSFITTNVKGELVLKNANVPAWKTGEPKTKEESRRDRKLLVHKSQARKFAKFSQQPGFTAIPLEAYVNNGGLVKILIGVGKGKKKYEKKQAAKEKDMKRRVQRYMKGDT